MVDECDNSGDLYAIATPERSKLPAWRSKVCHLPVLGEPARYRGAGAHALCWRLSVPRRAVLYDL